MSAPSTPCSKCGSSSSDASIGGLCTRCVALDFLKPDRADLNFGTDSGDDFEALVPGRFGDYEILEEIARGGMGVVYRARQPRLGREVALKFLLDGVLAGDTAIARFLKEAESAAALQHPNIVPIHEIGEVQGRHYFSMEYIRGRTLADLTRSGPIPSHRAATYLARIAEAVAYAHSRGVLHRDLKPSNVLVDERDEPRITDFGLAKRTEASNPLTLTGQVLGTPAYISPEQAGAQHPATVDEQSDVYSLGALLYHLLTGRPPFAGDSATAILRQVAEADPIAPRLLNPSVPRDLETICLHCLQKEPARRYAGAGALAADLERFLRDEPIAARPPGRIERTQRWCRRRPALAGALTLIAFLAVTIVVTSLRSARRFDSLRRQSLTNLYASDMRLAQQAIAEGHFGSAADLLARHRATPGNPDQRHFEWHHFAALCQSDEIATLGQHGAQVQRMQFSSDGQILASASGRVLAWELPSRRALPVLDTHDFVWALGLSPDGHQLVTGNHRGDLLRFDSTTGALLQSATHQGASILACAWPAGETDPLVISSQAITRWSTGSSNLTPICNSPAGLARAFVEIDGRRAAFLLGPTVGSAWNLFPPQEIARTQVSVVCRTLTLVPRTALMVAGDYSGRLHVFDLEGNSPEQILPAHRGMIECLAASSDGKQLASSGADQIVRVWDTATWKSKGSWHGHRSLVFALAFSPEGRWLASGDRQGEVKLWDLVESPHPPAVLSGPRGIVADDGSQLVVTQPDGSLVVRSASAQKRTEHRLPAAPGEVTLVAEGLMMARAGDGQTAVLRGDSSWRPLPLPARIGHGPSALSRTGRYVCAKEVNGSGGNVWDLETGRSIIELPQNNGWVSPTFSRDERLFAHGFVDGRVFVYELPTGHLRAAVSAHLGFSYACSFSADNRWLATAGFDATVRVWEVATLTKFAELRATADSYWCVAISPDGRRVAAGTGESSIVLWDVPSRLEVAQFNLGEPLRPVEGTLRFSPDGRALVRGGQGWNVWLAPADKNSL